MLPQSVSQCTRSVVSQPRPVLANSATAPVIVGAQNQRLTPMITRSNAPQCQGSSYLVEMPPAHIAAMHLHDDTEVQVMVLTKNLWAATISCDPDGSDLTVTVQGYRDICYIPAGRPHTAVNLSALLEITAVEFRPRDPNCNRDVRLLPELQKLADDVAAFVQHEHLARLAASTLNGASPW
jgi:uncharacterized RmlC-like cupin family protein